MTEERKGSVKRQKVDADEPVSRLSDALVLLSLSFARFVDASRVARASRQFARASTAISGSETIQSKQMIAQTRVAAQKAIASRSVPSMLQSLREVIHSRVGGPPPKQHFTDEYDHSMIGPLVRAVGAYEGPPSRRGGGGRRSDVPFDAKIATTILEWSELKDPRYVVQAVQVYLAMGLREPARASAAAAIHALFDLSKTKDGSFPDFDDDDGEFHMDILSRVLGEIPDDWISEALLGMDAKRIRFFVTLYAGNSRTDLWEDFKAPDGGSVSPAALRAVALGLRDAVKEEMWERFDDDDEGDSETRIRRAADRMQAMWQDALGETKAQHAAAHAAVESKSPPRMISALRNVMLCGLRDGNKGLDAEWNVISTLVRMSGACARERYEGKGGRVQPRAAPFDAAVATAMLAMDELADPELVAQAAQVFAAMELPSQTKESIRAALLSLRVMSDNKQKADGLELYGPKAMGAVLEHVLNNVDVAEILDAVWSLSAMLLDGENSERILGGVQFGIAVLSHYSAYLMSQAVDYTVPRDVDYGLRRAVVRGLLEAADMTFDDFESGDEPGQLRKAARHLKGS